MIQPHWIKKKTKKKKTRERGQGFLPFLCQWWNDHLPVTVHLKRWNKTYSISAFSVWYLCPGGFFFVLLLFLFMRTSACPFLFFFFTCRCWYTKTPFPTLSSQMFQGLKKKKNVSCLNMLPPCNWFRRSVWQKCLRWCWPGNRHKRKFEVAT